MSLECGARAELRYVVGNGDTAVALRSGDVAVLGTPKVVALCEEAAVAAIAGMLPAGSTTVGMRVQIDHLQPTAPGLEVVVEAVLEKIEGRRLTFHVAVDDPRGLVATGRVTRVVVDTERFLEKAH
jgi:predicted thioesterase